MKHKKQGTWLMTGGLLLIAAALLLTGYNLWDACRAERSATAVVEALEAARPESVTLAEGEVYVPDYLLDPSMEMPRTEAGGLACVGVLEIPALGLTLPVAAEWSYPALKKAPCRYTGSAYQANMVIAGHNYPSHFGRLKTLSIGDDVRFTDVDGNVFDYCVASLETLQPTAVEEMTDSGWPLTLFTCTVGGQTRLALRCEAAEGSK